MDQQQGCRRKDQKRKNYREKEAPQKNSDELNKISKGLLNKYKAKKRTAFPKNLSPMLATLTEQMIGESGWSFEIKWDGYRALAFLDNGKAELRSRNNKSFNDQFYPV